MMPTSAPALLSAMITPAVLITGAASILLSTSSRLGRATDRTRALTQRFEELVRVQDEQVIPLARAEQRLIVHQLPLLARRTRYLHRAMTSLYLSIGLLVLTSLLIGGLDLLEVTRLGFLPVVTALLGALALAYAASMLSYEASISAATTREEMAFLVDLSHHYADLYHVGEPGVGAGGSAKKP
ncbi:DUF2721 domain-containing protein [Deinococcus taklimakanensis]|uniref:DUF2721 domain-containing protein n=1 Tax=Deinococcus taklimakanensis TaxID=536443 RepID=A0ABW5P5V8_9DEIO